MHPIHFKIRALLEEYTPRQVGKALAEVLAKMAQDAGSAEKAKRLSQAANNLSDALLGIPE